MRRRRRRRMRRRRRRRRWRRRRRRRRRRPPLEGDTDSEVDGAGLEDQPQLGGRSVHYGLTGGWVQIFKAISG